MARRRALPMRMLRTELRPFFGLCPRPRASTHCDIRKRPLFIPLEHARHTYLWMFVALPIAGYVRMLSLVTFVTTITWRSCATLLAEMTRTRPNHAEKQAIEILRAQAVVPLLGNSEFILTWEYELDTDPYRHISVPQCRSPGFFFFYGLLGNASESLEGCEPNWEACYRTGTA